MIRFFRQFILIVSFLSSFLSNAQLFQDDFGTGFANISTTNWPTACRGGSASSFNTSSAPCGSTSDRAYLLSGFGSYVTTMAIAIPSAGYDLTFDYSFDYGFSFPTIEIRSGAPCGTTLLNSTTLTNTAGVCTPQIIDLSAYAGQTIYIRFRSNTSSSTFYFDNPTVDLSAGGGGGINCLLTDDFGTGFASISTTNWPTACRGGSPSSFNTSSAPCSSTSGYGYAMSGFGVYITTMALAIPSTGYDLTFDYSFNYAFSFPSVEIRTGGTCGTSLSTTTTLSNTSGVCTPQTINLDSYAGQTIFIRFRSNTSSAMFFLDEVAVCGTAVAGTGDLKWADNFNDNDLDLDFPGNDGDESCVGCGTWNLGGGASLALVPSGGWNGNTNTTEAFPDNMPNVYYAKLDRDEYIESPTIDLSAQESLKISFYAKSSSSATGGGDSWSSFSDHLRLQIWDGSSWITVKDITEGTTTLENKITPGLPLNYFCFSAYKTNSSPGNYYYTSAPNVNSAYFHSDFKFRVIFEDGFSGSPFAWVDDFTFRADADGYSTMIPCGISFWNQPAATSYGQDPGATLLNDSERGVELELDNAISIPPNWSTEANDGDAVSQVFGSGEAERVVFCVLSEQEIDFAFPTVSYSTPSLGNQSSVMSKDNSYSGPGWKYYAVEYVSCDLASSTISEPTDQFQYHFNFEYGIEFIPVFYQLNSSGIETGGGVTSVFEQFNAPDVISTDDCGIVLPIELIDFSATKIDNSVLLEWMTASELNSDYFELERARDGLHFETIATVNGAGNSNSVLEYSYLDLSPSFGTNYYRLKQTDFDGEFSVSDIEVVRMESDEITIYPNPTSGLLIIENHADLKRVSVADVNGKVLQIFNNNFQSIDISELISGIYFLRLETAEGVVLKKVIKR